MNGKWKTLKNWFNYPSLYDYAVQKCPSRGLFLEVGSYYGASVSYMVEKIASSRKSIRVVCVDTWNHTPSMYYDFLGNLADSQDYVVPVRMKSEEACLLFADGLFDFIFIDADHSYKACLADIRNWSPKLKSGGVLAGHDYFHQDNGYCGVKQAVDESFGADVTIIGTTWIKGKVSI